MKLSVRTVNHVLKAHYPYSVLQLTHSTWTKPVYALVIPDQR